MYKFVASSLAFYPYYLEKEFRAAGSWPEVGVDVNEFVYKDFKIDPPPSGMRLGADPSGAPCWVPIPPPTDAEILASVEDQRMSLIAKVDSISVIAWNSMDSDAQDTWVAYRKALVALPSSSGYPNKVTWPVQPEMP